MQRFLAIAVALAVLSVITGCTVGSRDSFASQPPNPRSVVPKPAPLGPEPLPALKNSTPKKTLQAFGSEKELISYLRDLAEKQKRENHQNSSQLYELKGSVEKAVAAPAAPALLTRADKQDDSVTNLQDAGVDEGGIVKLHGDFLVVLRRGRLFTVAVGAGQLAPVSTVNAFGPDIDPRSTWYDEMLISDNTIVVIGYSYERGGTEVGLFQIDPDGNLSYRSTYHLRSNDYYSSRNYASRLIGSKLIFYAPLDWYPSDADPLQSFPAVRKWHRGAKPEEFHRIVPPTQVYRTPQPQDLSFGTALHTVTVCDLAGGGFDCKATSVIGPPGQVFYVSPEAVYIWVTNWAPQTRDIVARAHSMVYRMPLDGSSPSALGVSGGPVDQFSFLESEDGFLNVLVRSQAGGDGMWGAERAAGSVSLLRVPLESFSDGNDAVPSSRYLKLPAPKGDSFENRFVGDYLLYGTGSGWGYPQKANRGSVYAVRWASGDWSELPLQHGTDRIEQMGSDALVVGTDGTDLHFTAVRLGDQPETADEYVRKAASQGELRSHGFFYKADARDSGMLGLPISLPGRPGYRHLFENSAAILFLRNNSLHFQDIGELGARPEGAQDDACRASCVDWYGNAQPLFVHGRVFALLGYELVEGSFDGGRLREVQRVSYAPRRARTPRAFLPGY